MPSDGVMPKKHVFKISPLPSEIRKCFTENIRGQTTCPVCKQPDIKVVNDGTGGNWNKYFNYLENHKKSREDSDLCPGSEKMLNSFR